VVIYVALLVTFTQLSSLQSSYFEDTNQQSSPRRTLPKFCTEYG